ncbi:hypothetical protein ACQEVB_06980 [Pseudonocardia sp. CA-107938]|uniref:hypothetical protein n=1 Tax=Pseudonocardia sp. CA-107938 TaxID=3240021 RepID=UPI003D8F9C51
MAESWLSWEVPELIARLDPGIAGRIAANHPGEGWCRPCGVNAPCSMRTLATAVERVAPPAAGDDPPPC